MLRISATDVLSCFTVRTGGTLFEWWIMCFGKMQSVRIINAHRKRRNHPAEKMSHDDEQKVLERERVTFYMELLRRLNHMGSNVVLQMFFVSLVSFFRGLSRRGMAIAAQMHGMLPLSTFDIYRRRQLDKCDARIRYDKTLIHQIPRV